MTHWMPWEGWAALAAIIAALVAAYFGGKAGGITAVGLILAVLGVRQRQAGYKDRINDERKEADRTRQRMEDADIVGDDPDLARRMLRERGQRK